MRRPLGLLMALCLSVPSGAEAAAYSLNGPVRIRGPVARAALPLTRSASAEKSGAALSLQSPASFSLVPQPLVVGPVLQEASVKLSAGQSLSRIGGSPDVSLASTRYFQGSLTADSQPTSFQLKGSDVRGGLRKANAGFQSLRRAVGPQSPVEKRVRRWVWPGIALGSVVPVLFKAAPFHFLGYVLPAALAVPVALLLGLGLFRLIRYLARRAPAGGRPAGRPAAWRSAVVGLALGLSLAVGAIKLEGPIIEKAAAVFLPQMEIRRVPGSALEVETIRQLQESPRGREILDHLRDRAGRIRMPLFFVATEKKATLAHYNSITDGVFIAADEIEKRGWTVEQFLSEPALQIEFAREFQYTFAHELTHANQARRSILKPGQFKAHFDIEWEYEAFLGVHYHTHQRLMDDPQTELPAGDLKDYTTAIGGLDAFFESIQSRDGYKDLPHSQDPYFQQYFAKLRASWPAHQVEGNMLLGLRALPTDPLGAAAYFEKALALNESLGKPAAQLPSMLADAYTRYAEPNVKAKPYVARIYLDKALAVAHKHGLPERKLLALTVESLVEDSRQVLARTSPGDVAAYTAKSNLDSAAALAKGSGILRPDLPGLYVVINIRLAQYWTLHNYPSLAQSYLDKAKQIVIDNNLPDAVPPLDSLGIKSP